VQLNTILFSQPNFEETQVAEKTCNSLGIFEKHANSPIFRPTSLAIHINISSLNFSLEYTCNHNEQNLCLHFLDAGTQHVYSLQAL